MEYGRIIERGVIFVLVVAISWQTYAVKRARVNLERALLRVENLTERSRLYTESLVEQGLMDEDGNAIVPEHMKRPPAPPPDLFSEQQPRPRRAQIERPPPAEPGQLVDPAQIEERRPRRRRAPPLPGAQVLNRLYDAADNMAMNEQWSQQTYDDVVFTFEETAEEMKFLWQDLKAREIDVYQAREEVELLRDDTNARLAAILGDEGLERLKTHILDEAAAKR